MPALTVANSSERLETLLATLGLRVTKARIRGRAALLCWLPNVSWHERRQLYTQAVNVVRSVDEAGEWRIPEPGDPEVAHYESLELRRA